MSSNALTFCFFLFLHFVCGGGGQTISDMEAGGSCRLEFPRAWYGSSAYCVFVSLCLVSLEREDESSGGTGEGTGGI
ncbi:hypothetical protein QBC44DRAFT_322924 [Cladorrhinum sp. PSN332]|nr:hypothetical protein QBC44DRAFT_322924 [Cladorrhinum sp. PSN332]